MLLIGLYVIVLYVSISVSLLLVRSCCLFHESVTYVCCKLFLDQEGGSQKATVVVLVVVISSVKIPKAFLIRSGWQRNFAYIFVLTFTTDLTSQIFHLFSN